MDEGQSHEARLSDNHLRWIYIINHSTKQPCGMRCWFGDYRCDIAVVDGVFEYWISECWNSGRDVYWTKPRRTDNVFVAMSSGEKWIREMQHDLDFPEDED